MSDVTILVLNSGSSSLKFGLYTLINSTPGLLVEGIADNIALAHGKLTLTDAAGKELRCNDHAFANPAEALATAATWLTDFAPQPKAIGHRVVHGGPNLTSHQRITSTLLDDLHAAVHFAPLHIPSAISLIEAAQKIFPQTPQFACFDTAFHTTMPQVASHLPLPAELYIEGIRRYGFHGLSYESIVNQLTPVPTRIVIAHLGSGASLCAVRDGRSVDTSMGLTPTGGIPMSTRSGDLDPGILLYLLRTKHLSIDDLETTLNKHAGLIALSNGISDLRDLEAASHSQEIAVAGPAQLALDVFTISIAKTVAAYTIVLGGIDLLVFSGGIGQHSALVRQSVCERLKPLGIALNLAANGAHERIVSTPQSNAIVQVLPSEEDLQIARHVHQLSTD